MQMQEQKRADDKEKFIIRVPFTPYDYAEAMFSETYNSIYLNKLSTIELTTLKTELEYRNPVLYKLIENYQKPKGDKAYLNIDYIEGPNELYVYKLVDKDRPNIIRTIYLFGEVHVNSTGKCKLNQDIKPGRKMTFTEYITDLLRNTSSFFDLYLELPLITKLQTKVNLIKIFNPIFDKFVNNPKTTDFQEEIKNIQFSSLTASSTFYDLLNNLSYCISPSSRDEGTLCNLTRVHVVDARNTSTVQNKMEIIFAIFNYFAGNTTLPSRTFFTALFSVINSSGVFPILSNIADGFHLNLNGKTQILFNLFAVQNQWIKKQLEKSYYRIQIEQFIKNILEKLIMNHSEFFMLVDQFVNDYNNYMETSEIDILMTKFEDISTLSDIFLYYTAYEMDIYCLSRIFKDFGKITNKRIRVVPVGQPKQSYNIIIYAGSKHTRKYLKFLEQLKDNGDIGRDSGLLRIYKNPFQCDKFKCSCIWMANPIFGDITDQPTRKPTRTPSRKPTRPPSRPHTPTFTSLPYPPTFTDTPELPQLPTPTFTDTPELPYALAPNFTDTPELPYALAPKFTDTPELPYARAPNFTGIPELPYAHVHELPYVSDDIDLPSGLGFDQPFSSFPGDFEFDL